jgi:hypothetical protein
MSFRNNGNSSVKHAVHRGVHLPMIGASAQRAVSWTMVLVDTKVSMRDCNGADAASAKC